MGKEYNNDDRFTLFKNDQKKSDNQPDRTGKITISEELAERIADGERDFRLAGWLTPSKNGDMFLSGRISPIEAKDQAKAVAKGSGKKPGKKPTVTGCDDDCPF